MLVGKRSDCCACIQSAKFSRHAIASSEVSGFHSATEAFRYLIRGLQSCPIVRDAELIFRYHLEKYKKIYGLQIHLRRFDSDLGLHS